MGRTGHGIGQRGRLGRAILIGCITALLLLAFTPAATAAPSHPHIAALDITGLNHACGAAVDSKGDVYAASAGESKVKVFNEAHTLLKEISNAHEPCGLAVDTSGNLYVSEKATGEVVRYHPSEYPPTASVAYTEATIDASGNAKGISVDPADNRLYVAEGNRVAMYSSEGTPGINESQQVLCFEATGGTYTLSFEGSGQSEGIPCEDSNADVQEKLEKLPTIGSGNVSVTTGPNATSKDHLVTFKGALAGTDVGLLVADASGLTGVGAKPMLISESIKGFNGHLGEGELSGVTGVASYTYGSSKRHFISAAEPGEGEIESLTGTNLRTLEPRATIDGSGTPDETPEGELGLASDASLAADPKSGHLFAYDATHGVLNEFEAGGRYFTRIANPALEDAGPTQVAVDRSGGAHDGSLYVSAGSGLGAKLAAFGPLVEPSRSALPALSHDFAGICGAAVDSQGDLYLAGATTIKVYDPSGKELGSLEDKEHPCGLAVDSAGNLYVLQEGSTLTGGDEFVSLYEPSAYPFAGAPSYAAPKTIQPKEEGGRKLSPTSIAVDPADGQLFVTLFGQEVREYGAAKDGSALLDPEFCGVSNSFAVDVYGRTGEVYVLRSGTDTHEIDVCNAIGTKVLAAIDGSGSPGGAFGELSGIQIAVDQSDGHVLVGMMRNRGVVEEYEPSGAFVGRYGSFTAGGAPPGPIALDNSGGPDDGNLYVAYADPAPGAFDLTALGPASYGEPPAAVTGSATAVDASGATLNGTIDPRGFDLEECAFEWGLAGHPYEHKALCAETPAQIGHGKAPVAVHLAVTGLEPQTTRYRFRLLAKNKFGEGEGEEAIFGPPIATSHPAQPILYREATLRGEVDSSGLGTSYRFEYLTQAEYEEGGESFEGAQSTPARSLPASGGGPVEVKAPLTGLQEGTAYRFLLLAENEAAGAEGLERSFETLQRPGPASCPNQTLRLEDDSGNLPDCRAYELVTPPDTRGAVPRGEEASNAFSNWLTTPSGPMAGDSLAFFVRNASLPGTEGNGLRDAFRSTRDPEAGWESHLFGPSSAQIGEESNAFEKGTAADQLYAFFQFGSAEPSTAYPPGHYLRTPEGSPAPSPNCAVAGHAEERFEWTGCGSLGFDPTAEGKYLSAGGRAIFSSKAKLEEGAASAGTESIYARTPAGPTEVVSLLPGDITPVAGAAFLGANEDAGAVVFSVAGKLYLRREGETVKVSDGPASFAGISENGERVLYTATTALKPSPSPATLYAFDVEGSSTTQIAADGLFADVSADGSRAYFSSEDKIGGEGSAGARNLYTWDGGTTKLVATLAADDLGSGASFPGTGGEGVALDSWAGRCIKPTSSSEGRGSCPARTTPDGRFLVFQSHAKLTEYENMGHSELYRYDAQDESLLCVSCDPSGVPATAEADLQSLEFVDSGTLGTTLIPNVTEDGSEVFFQTTAQLLPEDANSVLDVYEWRVEGAGGCEREAGCLALISSGQSDNPSYLYSMTPDGHDVFFSTLEKLVDADIPGSASIYDARVEGGFPAAVAKEPCHGDACQGEGSAAPELPAIGTQTPGAGNVEEAPSPPAPCGKGRHRVKGRCVVVHKHHHKRRAKRKGRAGR